MSNFQCEICGTYCYDVGRPYGYITGCKHYPPDVELKPEKIEAILTKEKEKDEVNKQLKSY